MTHRHGVACGRDIAARWCALAEQRLEHLTEMFETGRWRRFHSEVAFLENIQEAKRAVLTWRALAAGEDVSAATATVAAALGWSPARLSPRPARSAPSQIVQPEAVQIAAATPVTLDTTIDRLAEIIDAPIVPEPPQTAHERVIEFTFSLDGIEAKYPLLRNAF